MAGDGEGCRRGRKRSAKRHDAGARALQQEDEQHREHDDLELSRGAARRDHRQIVLDAVLEQGDDGGADHGARQVGHAAHHRHQQVEDADSDIERGGADEAAHMGVEPARQRRQQRGDDERHQLDAERIDAEALRHDPAAAQRAHRATLARIEQVGRQQQGHDQERARSGSRCWRCCESGYEPMEIGGTSGMPLNWPSPGRLPNRK